MSGSLLNESILSYLKASGQTTAYDQLKITFDKTKPKDTKHNVESLVGNAGVVDGIGDVVLWSLGGGGGGGGLETALSCFWVSKCVNSIIKPGYDQASCRVPVSCSHFCRIHCIFNLS